MNAIEALHALTEASAGVGLLIILVLMLRKPVSRIFGPQAAYLLWAAPALRLLLPDLNILPRPAFDIAAAGERFFVEAAPAATPIAANASSTFNLDLMMIVAFYLWVAVAFAWINVIFSTQRQTWRTLISASTPASAGQANEARAISKELGWRRRFDVRILDDAHGPMTAGLFRPTIFLPADFASDYSPAEQRLAIAHEIAHLARGDLWALLGASFVRVAQWPNPFAHIAFEAYRADQEAACDAYVLERFDRRAASAPYAAAIVKSARSVSAHPHFALALAHPVKERVMLIKNRQPSSARKSTGAVFASAAVVAGLAATASYGYAETDEQKKTIIKEPRISSENIFVAEDGEEIIIDGFKDAEVRKVIVVNEDGERHIRVFNADGDIVLEERAGADEDTVVSQFIVKRSGDEERVINLGDKARHPMVFAFAGADGVEHVECDTEGDDNVQVFAWNDSDESDDSRIVTKQIICTRGAAKDAPVEAKAEALRKAITHLEDAEKRSAERRRETIERLKKQLEELEKKNWRDQQISPALFDSNRVGAPCCQLRRRTAGEL
ncbi:MAG: M56 family metallopeptidase [Pseudomonadota bacterium]